MLGIYPTWKMSTYGIGDAIAAISAREEQDQDNLSKVVFPVSRPNAG